MIAVLLTALLAPAARADQSIGAIEISGNRTIDAESIRSHLAFRKGAPYEAAKIDQSVQALYATGLFSDVHIDRHGSTVSVSVVENPLIAKISFEGNSAVESSKLKPLLQLKARGHYSRGKAHTDALTIRRYYRQLGHATATVEPKAATQPDGQVNLVFAISEGVVAKVDRIAFVGNRTFTERQLRDVITTSQSGWFDFLKEAAFYDPERIEQDRELLRRYYLKNGFPDARITAVKATKNMAGTGYEVLFTVDEGERYTFAGADVASQVAGVDAGALRSNLQVSAGADYSEERIEKSIEKLTLAASEGGHPSIRIRPIPTRDEARHTIAIRFSIEDGPRLLVERIDIVGNVKTKDFVIRREFRVAEGDAINPILLERGRARVQRLGFFKHVALKQKPGSAPDKVIITIEVIEDDTRIFAVGGGYSTSEGLIGDLSFTERNLLGNGQQLRMMIAGSAVRFQGEIGFTEPHLLGSDWSGGFDLFYKDMDYTTQASYKSQRIGGDLRVGYAITDEWSAGANYTFTRSKLYDVGDNASAAIKEALGGSGDTSTYYTSSIGYSLTYDTRDSKKRPTSGTYYTLSQDLAGLGGDVRYVRSTGEARGYYPVSNDITLAGRVTGGTIAGWGGQDVRLLDLFQRGSETVRGFAVSGIGPRDMASVNQDALGGKMFVATTAEFLFNLPGVPQDIGLRGAVFADAGSLWGVNNTAAKLPGLSGSTFAPRASVGVGLAWDSPLGPLRADYAYPFLKQPYDKTQPFSFGLMPF